MAKLVLAHRFLHLVLRGIHDASKTGMAINGHVAVPRLNVAYYACTGLLNLKFSAQYVSMPTPILLQLLFRSHRSKKSL